ncbi:hypothetical protein SH2C18_44740 [Clostridium sediminicola]|uniref:accessory gene regulator ArgB-like protein n=1 Tax=Clostridium sediminicola TaxID=3114879 RepID=UPI0031F27322
MQINNFIKSFSNIIAKKNLMSTGDISKTEYTIKTFFYEIVKISLLIILFAFWGHFDKFIFALILLTSIGYFSGGFHFYNNIYSFLFSVAFFIFAIVILPTIPFINNLYFYFVISYLSIIIIFYFSPIPSKSRPITSFKHKEKAKTLALSITLFWLVILFTFFYHSKFFTTGIWTIVLQSIQLIISGCINHEKSK